MRNIWTTLYYLVWWHLVPSTCYNGNFEICNFPPSWAWAIISNLLNATRYPTISLAWLDRWHQVGLQRYDQLFCAHNELWRPFLDYLFRNWREKFGCMAWSWSVGIVLLLHDDGIQDKVISRARTPSQHQIDVKSNLISHECTMWCMNQRDQMKIDEKYPNSLKKCPFTK